MLEKKYLRKKMYVRKKMMFEIKYLRKKVVSASIHNSKYLYRQTNRQRGNIPLLFDSCAKDKSLKPYYTLRIGIFF